MSRGLGDVYKRQLCNPVIVMAEGTILMEDTISNVKENEKVIEVYLGRS